MLKKILRTLKQQFTTGTVLQKQAQTSALCARLLQEQLIQQILSEPKYTDPRNIARFRKKVFSQFGQDGIISEIVSRLNIHTGTFIEVGVSPLESNTSYLALLGWKGTWFDPSIVEDPQLPPYLQHQITSGRLKVVREYLNLENTATLIQNHTPSQTVDVVSLDIDYNTHHLWSFFCALQPKVYVIEYNSHIFPPDDWSVPADFTRSWQGDIIYGASLKKLELMGREFGYSLVGCDIAGTDAFFVRNDLLSDQFQSPYTAERHFEPPRFFLDNRVTGHPPAFPTFGF
jgi:hypothetical protein